MLVSGDASTRHRARIARMGQYRGGGRWRRYVPLATYDTATRGYVDRAVLADSATLVTLAHVSGAGTAAAKEDVAGAAGTAIERSMRARKRYQACFASSGRGRCANRYNDAKCLDKLRPCWLMKKLDGTATHYFDGTGASGQHLVAAGADRRCLRKSGVTPLWHIPTEPR